MSNKTRKGVRPAMLAAALGVVAMLAVLAALALPYGPAYAQTPFDPPAPTGVNAAANSDGTQVMVTWTAGTGGAPATGYEVERKVGTGNYESADPAHSGTTPSYTDHNVSAGMTYTYRVRATNSISVSAWVASNEVAVTAPANNPPVAQDPPELDPIVGLMITDADGNSVSNTEVVEDIAQYFSDSDGDTLTLTPGSSDTSTATAEINAEGDLVITAVGAGDADITVTADDGNGGTVRLIIPVTVQLSAAERYHLWHTDDDDMRINSVVLDAPATQEITFTVSAVDADGSKLDEDATVNFVMQQFPESAANSPLVTRVIGWDSSTDSNIEDDDIIQGLLTVRAVDPDGERGFTVHFRCVEPGDRVEIDMLDEVPELVAEATISCGEPEPDVTPGPDDTTSDHFTVASYGDWEYHDVTDGFILDVGNGNLHMINDHPIEKRGLLRRDEPVIHADYTLGVSNIETLEDMDDGSPRRVKTDADLTRQEKNAYVEEGQRTIEVLADQPNVQLTVTSMEPSPAYIRFLDKYMRPFGTDVDEEPMWRGADVVGLDSQGRLELNNQVTLSAAKALAYDQYSIKTPDITEGQPVGNSYLVGAAGDYNQGAFRFMNPCPEVGHHFYVQVYESTGKYLETTEKIVCVPSPRPGPTGLEFTVDSQEAGKGELTYRHALNADEHTVLLVDAHSRTIVTGGEITDAPEMVEFGPNGVGPTLNDGWRYHFIVVAHGVNDQYTADAITVTTEWIDHADAADSTLTAGAPTRTHIVCQTGNAEVMALLADCDEEPVIPPMLGKPTNVMARIDDSDPGLDDIVVTWMDGANADVHHVYLVPTDFNFANIRNERITSGGTHTFMDVAPDTYIVAVQSTSPTTEGYEYAIAPALITVGGQ